VPRRLSRIDVNGDPDLTEDVDRDEEAGEQEQHAEELPELEPLGVAEAAEVSPSVADDRPDRDEDRRRHAAVEPAGDERPDCARERRDQVDDDRDRRDDEVEQELVTGWFGSSE
jgi:hypothetical protein